MAVTSGLSLSPDINVEPVRSLWTPSWPLLMGLVAFVWLAFGVSQPMLGDPDTHWHITVGNWILQHHTVPRTDIYSYTFAGQPWIAKEWLSQVLLAGAYDIGGWGGVVVLAAAAVATAFALLLRFLLRDLTPFPALLFTVAAFTLASTHFLARPHVLAFPVMVWWVAGLVRAVEERRAPKPVLLIAMLLWANLHGGFTLGFVLAGALGLDALIGAKDATERRTLFVAWAKFGVATFLAACITPYGPESMLVTLRIFGLGDALSVITEWRSPNFQEQPMQELLLLLAIYLALSRGLKLPLIRLLIVIGLVHLFLKYARNAELLAMLAPLVIAPVLVRQWPLLPRVLADGRFAALARPAGRGLVALCLGVTALLAVGLVRFGAVTAPEATTPLAALKFAREAGLKGHVFNHYGYGGFLIESGIPTFIDGRGELFGGDFINRYVDAAFLRGKGTPLETILDEFKIEWTFLSKDMPANKLLARMPGWRLAYSDDEATIFVRDH